MGNPPSFVPGSNPIPPPPLVKGEGQPEVPEGLGSSQVMVEPLTEGPQLPSPSGVQVGEERHFLDWPKVTQIMEMATLQHSDVSIRGVPVGRPCTVLIGGKQYRGQVREVETQTSPCELSGPRDTPPILEPI